ncbi:MAG: RtcB family protein [Oligoflexia bacterium]|nr:RtcB family protein [Oligoflexia bacterium]
MLEAHGRDQEALLEEAPAAYKDVNQVVGILSDTNIARIVAKFKPVVVIKG